jgi:hypothetical protein
VRSLIGHCRSGWSRRGIDPVYARLPRAWSGRAGFVGRGRRSRPLAVSASRGLPETRSLEARAPKCSGRRRRAPAVVLTANADVRVRERASAGQRAAARCGASRRGRRPPHKESQALAVARAHVDAWSNHDLHAARIGLTDEVKVTVTTTSGVADMSVGVDDDSFGASPSSPTPSTTSRRYSSPATIPTGSGRTSRTRSRPNRELEWRPGPRGRPPRRKPSVYRRVYRVRG